MSCKHDAFVHLRGSVYNTTIRTKERTNALDVCIWYLFISQYIFRILKEEEEDRKKKDEQQKKGKQLYLLMAVGCMLGPSLGDIEVPPSLCRAQPLE